MNSRVTAYGVLAVFLIASGILLLNRVSSILSFSASTVALGTTEVVTIDNKSYTVEVAATTAQQAAGLSNRKALAQNAGMLFPFNPPSQPYFWMKDMRFPIDIVWINNNKIVSITHNAAAARVGVSTTDLPTYQPGTQVDNVLEINAGEAASFNIGDEVIVTTQSGI